MANEQGSQEAGVIENPPLAYQIPGEQTLCTLVRVVATPEGLDAVPAIAVVAEGDRVLWYATPGVGPFMIGFDDIHALDFKADDDGAHHPVSAPAMAVRKVDATGGSPLAHVWHTGMSHVIGARPTQAQQMIRYWLWRPDGSPREAMTLLVSPPRFQTFEASGTVRPEEDPV